MTRRHPSSLALEIDEPALPELPQLRQLSEHEVPSPQQRRQVRERLHRTLAARPSRGRRRTPSRVLLAAIVLLAVPSAVLAMPLGAPIVQRLAHWLGQQWPSTDTRPETSATADHASQIPPKLLDEATAPTLDPPSAPTTERETSPPPETGTPGPHDAARSDVRILPPQRTRPHSGWGPTAASISTNHDVPPAAGPRPAVRFGGTEHDLPAERRLLERARLSLNEGDAEGALGLAAEHERRFPDGLLSKERQAIQQRARLLEQRSREN